MNNFDLGMSLSVWKTKYVKEKGSNFDLKTDSTEHVGDTDVPITYF